MLHNEFVKMYLGVRSRSRECLAEVNGGEPCSQLLSDPNIPLKTNGNETQFGVSFCLSMHTSLSISWESLISFCLLHLKVI